MKDKSKIFFNSVIAALSSFIYGLFQTSSSCLSDVLKKSYNSYKFKLDFIYFESMFTFIVFLGAFTCSLFIYLVKNISRKNLLIYNNFLYLVGSFITILSKNCFVLLAGRCLVGFAAGVTCYTVPSYIFGITYETERGFFMSFHSIGIVLGLVIGKILDVVFSDVYYFWIFLIISFLIVIHTVLLLLISNGKTLSLDHEHSSIKELIKDPRAKKSVFLALSFHIAQHASGIDHLSLSLEEILYDFKNPGLLSILSLSFSALISIICCSFIDKLGRKIMIIISTVLMALSTFIMGFDFVNLTILFIYFFGFNIGMASIPWFITNEIFPPDYVNSALRLTIATNWFSAFIISCILKILHNHIDRLMFFFYSLFMILFLIVITSMFRETKNEPPKFQ